LLRARQPAGPLDGTRAPFSNAIGSDGYFANIGNSNYNSLQSTLKRTKGALTLLASYTFSKSLDWSSNIQEQVDPYDYRKQYGISHFDIKHNAVVSYNYELPLEKLFHSTNRLAQGWSVSGITRFSTGLPVTFTSFGDNALLGVQNNGVNGVSLDLPNVVPGDLQINHDPRNGKPYFNTSLFSRNALGTPGLVAEVLLRAGDGQLQYRASQAHPVDGVEDSRTQVRNVQHIQPYAVLR